MDLRRVRFVISVLALWAAFCGSAGAQLITGGDSVIGKLNPFHPFDPSQPVAVWELCKRLDCVAEELRDDGLVVVKQPDVFSQARLTRFRNDFDNQMSTDLNNFHLVLAARINRLDSATTTSTTALSAALAAPGTSNVSQPITPPTFMDTSRLFPTPTSTVVSPTAGTSPFSAINLANQGYGTTPPPPPPSGWGSIPRSTSTRRSDSSNTSTRSGGSAWVPTRTIPRATVSTSCACPSRSLLVSVLITVTAPS